MAKPSALDAKITECEREIAQMESDLDKWKIMRDFLKRGVIVNAEKPKRGRGKAKPKPGLPAAEQMG